MSQGRVGIPFVVSGPSGVGKSSILRRALELDPELRFSVSHTTRPPRPDEVDTQHYYFVSEFEFRDLITEDCFLEHAEYQGNLYGTSRDAVSETLNQGLDLILEVEVQGAAQLRERLPDAVFIFILPPSLDLLEQRLRGRGSAPEEQVLKRLARAKDELREVRKGYDYVIVNQEFDRAVEDLLHVIASARLQRDRVLPLWRDRLAFE